MQTNSELTTQVMGAQNKLKPEGKRINEWLCSVLGLLAFIVG
jgi:hypothetical protein